MTSASPDPSPAPPAPLLWAPAPHASHADEAAQYRQRWQRRTWQLHRSVLVSHVYAVALLVGFCLAGYADAMAVAGYALWIAAGMAFITWAYASGWCHTRRDPGLFLVHQGVSITGVLALLVAAPQVAFQVLVMLIAFSADGFLARSRTSFAVTWVVTVALGSVAIVALGPQMRMPTATLAGQLLTVGVLLGAVVRCVTLVTFFRGIQYRLAVTNDRLAKALARIETLARTDDLTGLPNRRGTLEALAAHRARAERSQWPLCVALLDVDQFKRINDEHGHATGDQVLRTLGELLRGHVRAVDTAGRYGGEEFLLVLPEAALPQAVEVLERLQARMAAQPWATVSGAFITVTATIGVTEYRPGESVEATIARADAALYRGKLLGRNQVVAETPAVA